MRTALKLLNAQDMLGEIDRFWGDIEYAVYDERQRLPACNVLESDDHYLVSFDVPGLKREDIHIDFNDGLLTVSGERRQTSVAKHKAQRVESVFGSFKRSVRLPVTIDASQVEARMVDGVLEIYLPKTLAARPRRIEIQTEKSGIFDKLLGGRQRTDVQDHSSK